MAGQRRIDQIVVHCSDSPYGDAKLIDDWHRRRGFARIGYHFVILNGYPDEESYMQKRPMFHLDGSVEEGRALEQTGAHVRGHNRSSVGICLIGKRQFTRCQFDALVRLVGKLRLDYPDARLVGHYELLKGSDPPKTCPNMDMDWIRGLMM